MKLSEEIKEACSEQLSISQPKLHEWAEKVSRLESLAIQATRDHYEPYYVTIPDDETPVDILIIKNVQEGLGLATISTDSYSFCIPLLSDDQRIPQIGDTVKMYGKGLGYTIDGIAVNDQVVYWRDSELSEQNHRRFKEDFNAKEARHRSTFKADPSRIKPFKIKAGKEKEWATALESNSDHGYSYEIFCFASNWASLMDDGIACGMSVENVAKAAENHALRDSDLTGFMYGCAVQVLAECWEHGEALRQWHNNETNPKQAKEANEKGITLNPALFSVGS